MLDSIVQLLLILFCNIGYSSVIVSFLVLGDTSDLGYRIVMTNYFFLACVATLLIGYFGKRQNIKYALQVLVCVHVFTK